MVDRESAEFIEVMNKFLGTNHRTKPYNLTDDDDLKQALKLAVAACRDYKHYADVLSKVVEDFDESMEHFDIVTWANKSRAPEKADALVIQCAESLAVASESFYELSERAEMDLSLLLKVIMTAQDATQIDVLGKVYDIKPDEIDARLGELFEMLYESEYHHSIDDNHAGFLRLINNDWSCLFND
jgi:hypothetical protein